MDDARQALEQLGKTIRRLRLSKGLSQEEFAHHANLDRSYIGQIERGDRNLSFYNILKVSRALGVKVSELMEEVY